MIELKKIKSLSERLTSFLKRKRRQKNIEIKELEGLIRRELESMLKDAQYRKMIQRIARNR